MEEQQKYAQPYPAPGYQPGQQPPYGYPPPSEGYPPQGYAPQGYPQQGYPPPRGYYQQPPPVVAPPQYNQQPQSNSPSSKGFMQGWSVPLLLLQARFKPAIIALSLVPFEECYCGVLTKGYSNIDVECLALILLSVHLETVTDLAGFLHILDLCYIRKHLYKIVAF